MQHLIRHCRRLVHEEAGQGLVEYGVIVVLIAIGSLSLLAVIFSQVAGIFGQATTTLQTLMAHR